MKRCLILATWLLTLTTLWGQEDARSVIGAIEVRNSGAGRVDMSYVMAHTRMRVGEPLDRSHIGRDVRSLLDTGRFSSVDVDIEPRDEGVAVVYVIRRKMTLGEKVIFTGSRHLREKKLRSLLDLGLGDRVDDHVLGVRTRAIRDAFRDDYYPDVALTWDIEETDHAQGLARLLVHIESGARSKVKSVLFEGNTQVGYSDLRRAIGRPSPLSPLWLFRKKRYDSNQMEAMRMAVLGVYRQRGFLDVVVDYPAVEIDAEGRQTITLTIQEGIAYRFGNISVEGVERFPQAEIDALVMARTGDTASSTLIDAIVQGIEDYYGSRGYARARVRPLLESNRAAGTVVAVFAVSEGELIRVGNIRIRGNRRTRDKVIRREIQLYPGDILNEVKARRSERKLMNLGFFSDVRRYQLDTSVPNREDVVYDVEEKRSGQFLFGAGFSSVDNVIGFVEVSQGNFDIRSWPNFTGGGQKLKLRAQFGSERTDYQLSLVEPWFLDRKLSLGLDLFKTDLNYTDYDLERVGAAVSLSKPLPGPNRITFRYSLQETKITDVADTNEYVYADSPSETYTFNREENVIKSTLRTSLIHDTRNNPFIPSRGLRATIFGELSGGPFGFDTDIYGLGASASLYIPLWWNHVLTVRGRGEVVETFGGTDEVTISDRLFAGGGRTIRGFGYRDVGPKVVRDEPYTDTAGNPGTNKVVRSVGGQSMALGTLEYTIPLVDGIRLAAFYDVGGVWRDAYEFNAGNVASSAGVGLRLDMPGFPIRIDYAWDLEADDELTGTESWVIWIGYDN
ncbi:MAG: outer membrane protein assembly factor BamA [Lentisphaerae bacterium]|nr:outer membrane protein assembly factor BamA [Lentisphaerota bacterium]